MLADSLPFSDYHRNLSGAVVGFAKVVAQELMLTGELSFEIKIAWTDEGHTLIGEFTLESIPRRSLIGIRPLLFQVIPRNIVREQPSDRLIRLDASRIVTFRPPKKWRAAIAHFREGCRLLGRSEHAWRREAAEGRFTESVKDVRRQYNVHLARLSAPLGWNGRGRIQEESSDFHWVLRELQWRRVCIDVREEILTTLRSVFATIGALKGEHPQLEWRDLPTTDHVEEGFRRIAEGAKFSDVLKPFHLRFGEGRT